MLVGVKISPDGSVNIPKWVNCGLDVDVIVSEVRETSRKPEEAYGLIERLCPGGRKVEIFGRRHNTRPGWLTLGNQLGDDRIYEEDMVARIKAAYVSCLLITFDLLPFTDILSLPLRLHPSLKIIIVIIDEITLQFRSILWYMILFAYTRSANTVL